MEERKQLAVGGIGTDIAGNKYDVDAMFDSIDDALTYLKEMEHFDPLAHVRNTGRILEQGTVKIELWQFEHPITHCRYWLAQALN